MNYVVAIIFVPGIFIDRGIVLGAYKYIRNASSHILFALLVVSIRFGPLIVERTHAYRAYLARKHSVAITVRSDVILKDILHEPTYICFDPPQPALMMIADAFWDLLPFSIPS